MAAADADGTAGTLGSNSDIEGLFPSVWKFFASVGRFLMKLIIAITLAASMAGCPTESEHLASPAATYDASWYKIESWGGEYPNGFTMATDITINIRGRPDLDAPKSISCVLRKGATYHPWNDKRVISDRLEFVSFTKIETYELKASSTVELSPQSGDGNTTTEFKKGDRWSYLADLAEGNFLIKFGDKIYIAGQDLYEKSIKVEAPVNSGQKSISSEKSAHEWLKLKCANDTVGWIFFNEIKNAPGLTGPNIVGYGIAADLQSHPKSAAKKPHR